MEQQKEYMRSYLGFSGVDLASDPADVSSSRFSDIKNMWRDYKSEHGGAIETVPGYRLLHSFFGEGGSSKINGIHPFSLSDGRRIMAVHRGERLYVFDLAKKDSLTAADIDEFRGFADAASSSFVYHDSLYILDGADYHRIFREGGRYCAERVSDNAHVPITYSDGEKYEQRNMLTDKFIEKYNLVNLEDYTDTETSGLFEYTLGTDTATVTGFAAGSAGSFDAWVRIPRSVVKNGKTYTVTSIASNAFASNHRITRVSIPATASDIGDGAFSGCGNLASVEFDFAYEGNAGSMRDGAVGVDYRIGAGAFANCPRLGLVVMMGKSYQNSGGSSIGKRAFSNCGGGTEDKTLRVFLCDTDLYKVGTATQSEIFRNLPFVGEGIKLLLYHSGACHVTTPAYGDTDDDAFTYLQKYIDLRTDGSSYEYVSVTQARYSGAGHTLKLGTISGTPEKRNVIFQNGNFTYYHAGGSNGDSVYVGSAGVLLLSGYGSNSPRAVLSYQSYDDADLTDTYYQYRYRFPLYERVLTVDDVKVNDTSVRDDANYKVLMSARGEYISEIVLFAADKLLIDNAVLTIHGTADPAKFGTVEGYLDALGANKEYRGTAREAICGCRICQAYDGRIFFAGNPALPNTVFYSHRDLTGANNASYFGVLNYFNDGVGANPIVAMIATASSLVVFKADSDQEGTVYYHSGADTGFDIVPRVYPSFEGLSGIGAVGLGAARNFFDDPVFLSRRGLEAIGKEQTNLERAIEHRSFYVDARLASEDLSAAKLTEWMGYLCILCGKNMYLADSRQIYAHGTGVANYEFYLISDLGEWRGQVDRYHTMTEDMVVSIGDEAVHLTDLTVYVNGIHHPLRLAKEKRYIEPNTQITVPAYYGGRVLDDVSVSYTVSEGGEFILLDTEGEKIGGEYFAPCAIATVDDVLYFGTEGGGLFCFNTDKRGTSVLIGGEEATVDRDRIHEMFYTFDGRRIESFCLLRADNCDAYHLSKSTQKKSLIVRTKSFLGSALKVRARIERRGDIEWRELGTYVSSEFDFSNIEFDKFSLSGRAPQLCIVREGPRKWYSKQLCFYSDEYKSPIGIYSAVYRYTLGGRIRI